jgi:hypothetical protein
MGVTIPALTSRAWVEFDHSTPDRSRVMWYANFNPPNGGKGRGVDMGVGKITKFDKKNVGALRPVIEEALTVLEKFGLTAEVGFITYGDTNFTTKLKVTTTSNGESEFRKYARDFKLKPDWFGKTFQDGKNTFEIIGLNENRSKFPVQIRNTQTQKTLSASADYIRRLFGDEAEVEKELHQQFAENWSWLKHSPLPGLQIEWLGKKINGGDQTVTILGLDKEPYGRKQPKVTILDAEGKVRVATVSQFMELMKRYNKAMLKTKKAA